MFPKGIVFKTTSGCLIWKQCLNSIGTNFDLFFINNIGWACGTLSNIGGTYPVISKTTSSGLEWNVIYKDENIREASNFKIIWVWLF
jgi:hypothetical protein